MDTEPQQFKQDKVSNQPKPTGEHQACENTDRELWREREGDYYADSIHVTKGGGIGINCGGHVFVKTLRAWHELAQPKPTSLRQEATTRQAGEWTVEYVTNLMLKSQLIDQPSFGVVIADAHNAALDAEQKKARTLVDALKKIADMWNKRRYGNDASAVARDALAKYPLPDGRTK